MVVTKVLADASYDFSVLLAKPVARLKPSASMSRLNPSPSPVSRLPDLEYVAPTHMELLISFPPVPSSLITAATGSDMLYPLL